MADHNTSEAARDSVSTQPVVPSTLPPQTSSSSRRKNRSAVWDHFTPKHGSVKKAKCNYCGIFIQYSNGTSSMRGHLARCKASLDKKANKRRRTSTLGADSSGVTRSPSCFKFNQEVAQRALVEMFVLEELPFRFVESKGFQNFLNAIQARFKIPSRTTLAHDILALYAGEKMKLQKFLSMNCGRVCLTNDTWTSTQNLNYMSLTAHFIDIDWKLHKKILNFCQVTDHSGEIMGMTIETCLNNWQLNRVFSLTVDDISSNDPGIQYLKKRLISWNSVILKSEYIHMRCCAHVLNLIVKEGLKEIGNSILRIRGAIKYVKSSPSRLARFKNCVEQEKIQYKGLLCLDVETQWKSTFRMLKVALKHRKAFDLLGQQDNKYVDELSGEEGQGVPSESDWEYAQSMLPFLKMFNDAILRIFGTSYVTSDVYMKEVFAIGRSIYHYCEKSDDVSIMLMAERIKIKYDKYWGNPNSMNMLLLIAVVLNPMQKLDYVNYYLEYFFGEEKGSELELKLLKCLKSLYHHYQGTVEAYQGDAQDLQINNINNDLHGMRFFLEATRRRSDTRSELDQYLQEECEPYSTEFDILNWWKVNSSRFRILANMAREVLAIPVSTLASKSAFSGGGRVLDAYHSSLTPKMVEALVCTQDWLKGDLFSSLELEDFEELEEVE